MRRFAALLLALVSASAMAFTTPPSIDTTAPVLTGAPQVLYLSNSSATIRWVTDEIADSTVSYGATGGPLSLVAAEALRRAEHLITLTGLSPSTAYSYSVASTDPSGNTVTSATFSFATPAAPDTSPPVFAAGPAAAVVASTSATLGWTVNEPASAVVAYGTSAGALNQQVAVTEYKTSHGVMLTHLAPDTPYFYRVTVTDLAGNSTLSALGQFTTLAPQNGPLVPLAAGFNLVGNGVTVALDVPTMFGILGSSVEAVWAWNAATHTWRFYTPQFEDGGAGYASANGYEHLTSVAPGAGFWVSATLPFNLPLPAGVAYVYDPTRFGALPPSFNLLAIGNTLTVQQFNASVGAAPANFNALWGWDAARTKWYFYSPQLELPGAPFSNAQYCTANGYYDFGGGTPPAPALSLQPGTGFWVEKN